MEIGPRDLKHIQLLPPAYGMDCRSSLLVFPTK